MLASLYLNTSTQLRKDEIVQKLQSAEEQDKIEAMQQIIAQMSQGEDFTSLTYKITKETLMMKSNELKRLFYYYLELVPKSRESESFGEILLLSNQIRKDLEHPNEYVRGFVMRFVSTLEDQELVGNFYKLVKDNFNHPNAYVRRNAYFCLGVIFSRMDIYKEVPDLLYHALFRDLDPNCLRQAFVSLHSTSPELAMKYANEVSMSIPSDLSAAIIDKIPDETLLSKFLLSEDPLTAFEAAIAMHRVTQNEELLKRSTDVILRCLDDLPDYKEYAIDELSLSPFSFSNCAMSFLSLIDPYDLSLCTKCLDFVFKIAETHEFLQISDFLCYRFMDTCDLSAQNQNFRILLLEKMAYFADVYSTYNDEMVDEALKSITSDNPAMAYASLRFVSSSFEIMRKKPEDRTEKNGVKAQKNEADSDGSHIEDADLASTKKSNHRPKYDVYINALMNKVNEVKYGKILRYCLEILRKNINRDVFERMIGIFDGSFELPDKPLYLRGTQTFLGSFICIELSEMCMEMQDTYFKERVIAIMLKFVSYGKKNGTIDLSSHSTIISCIRSLLSPSKSTLVSPDEHRRCNIDVLCPDICPGIRHTEDVAMDRLYEFLSNGENTAAEVKNVVQLTGLSDPIYVEATASYTRFEVVLDMLFINQTPSYLQNILLDFVTSPSLSSSFINAPFSLSGRSVITKRLSFRIIDASNGFISGSMTFRYPNETGEYANTTYSLNLSEIRTSVSEFLEPRKMSPDEFRETWKGLEWENTYTLKFVSNWTLEDIFNGVGNALKGEVLSLEYDESYAVGNIVCSTLQNVCVLVNICLQRGEHVHFESRIRSRKEGIVKSISVVVGDVLKSFRNK